MDAYTKITGSYPSANGRGQIAYAVYQPHGDPRAILQLSHGMCEYLARYEDFIAYLTDRGFVVCGNDHLGHGGSAGDIPGYFGPRRGYAYLPRDLYQLTLLMRESYPDLPYFLMGHSMGSFIAREYIHRHGSLLDGAVLSGTSGRQPAYPLGLLLSRLICLVRGKTYRSRLLDRLAFGGYNKRFGGKYGDAHWLTRDTAAIEAYRNDPLCTFTFTAQGMNDLFHLVGRCNRRSRCRSLPKDLPLLLISGGMDPVGRYGKGVRQVARRMERAGATRVTCKLYPDNRHECLNESNREEVYEDILAFLESQITGRNK